MEFDWSLWRALANGLVRVRGCWSSAILFRDCDLPEDVFHRIVIDGATLHFERSLSGVWNVEDAFQVDALEGLVRTVGRWRIPAIEGNDVSVTWVEQLPGASGGGLVEQRYSSMDFTKVSVGLANLQVPVDDRNNPTRFTFDGQTADGTVSVAGQLNVSRWANDRWAPSYDLMFRLVNVGAATFGRFAAPDATVVPTSGVIDGQIRLARADGRITACKVDVRLRNISYGANPRSPFFRAGGPALEQQLRAVSISDIVSRDCALIDGPGEQRRVSQALQTIVTAGALDAAPPIVQSAAGYDQTTVVEGMTPKCERPSRPSMYPANVS